MKNFIQNLKKDSVLILVDCLCIALAYFGALLVRFEFQMALIPGELISGYLSSIPCVMAGMVIIYFCCHLYHRVWRFASTREMELCVVATAICMGFHWLFVPIIFQRMPCSYFVLGACFQGILLVISRFLHRLLGKERFSSIFRKRRGGEVPVMVIGAGIAGSLIIREINTLSDIGCKVRCVIDDDKELVNKLIEGVPVVGDRDDILYAVKKYGIRRIFFAIPSMSVAERTEILNICKETGCELKTLPGIYQLASNEVSVSQMRDVAIEDLLGREPIQVDNTQILNSLQGQVVMVTGGGGSIGAELCRQIANHSPKQLIIFDIYENNAYDIQQELKKKHGTKLNLVVLIGSVRDTRRINQVFQQYTPAVVFHAAAHKHVPLMEDSPCEAIKNNVLGTYKTACAAIANGTRRFVLISTDKAVNPTNIMGASKRLCEMVVQTLEKLGAEDRLDEVPLFQMHNLNGATVTPQYGLKSPLMETEGKHTEFVAVRFGNVLGSNGSVVPLFKKQIAEGGPVTITSPDIIRYFMTIPEAVSLVLQAESYADGGEVFVFDMGEPVKIDTLARNLIKLSGFKPDVDIKIAYIGLRKGEKKYEERLMDTEGLKQTENKLISVARPVIPDSKAFFKQLKAIANAAYTNADEMKTIVSKVVPTYKPSNETSKENM